MTTRAKSILTPLAAELAEPMAETRGTLKMVLSGAIMAFAELTGDERDYYCDLANGKKPAMTGDKLFEKKVVIVLEKVRDNEIKKQRRRRAKSSRSL